jgi:hypothetical protein
MPDGISHSLWKNMSIQDEWNAWMSAHAGMIKETYAGGKTKRMDKNGVADAKNDIMLYSIIEAESHDKAAKAYEGHPHLGIPEATIEIMAIRSM